MTDSVNTVLVCGGGNGAHTLAAIASAHANTDARVMTLYADEAERWSHALGEHSITLSVTYTDGKTGIIQGKPHFITKDPEKAMDGVNVIFFVVPAFAHQQYFNAIIPYMKPNTIIVGLPGQAGFEFQALSSIKSMEGKCAIMSLESLPWACRITKFGTDVQVLGFKEALGCSMILGTGQYKSPPIEIVQKILGKKPVIKQTNNYLAVTLMAKSIIHPPVMYGKWSTWDGTPLSEKPLFYQGVTDIEVALLESVSDEVVATAQEVQKQHPSLDMTDVIGIFDWYKNYYHIQIHDNSSVKTCMRTNRAYEGLFHPMKAVEGGFVPDFTYRYTSEDIPFGLVVLKGIAELAGVPTPTMDKVIAWAQEKLGKSYIVGSDLKGSDLQSTRAPQAYGFKSLSELCKN